MTHTFKLTSGIECEVNQLIGKHQRWLTENEHSNFTDRLNKVLSDVIVRIGTKTDITENDILSMLSSDRVKALIETRRFTMDFEDTFEFDWEYINSKGERTVHNLAQDFSEGFNEKPLMVMLENGEVEQADYSELSQIVKEVKLVLPKSGKRIIFNLLDGEAEKRHSNTKKSERSSHTPIKMRNPREIVKSQADNDIPIQLDLDKLSFKDIEFLRKTIKEFEGKLDTEIMFEHPEADLKPSHEKNVVVDIISQVAFFFPSEAI